MAKQKGQQASEVQSNTFIKGLNKDADPVFVQEGMWTHARNAVNNTAEGDLGTLSNEESNGLCALTGLTMNVSFRYIVGSIHLFSDKWVIYTAGYDSLNTTHVNSEIGLFESELCIYRPMIQDPCLNFSKLNLITGASKLKDDCSWQVYWADGLNPDRFMNLGDPKTWPSSNYTWLGGAVGSLTVNYYSNGTTTNLLWPGIPWICDLITDGTDPACLICADTNAVDCDKLRLARLMKTPCFDINLSQQQGVLENGSYAVAGCYVINRQRVTNYFSIGYTQPVFNDINEKGSFQITVDADSENFEEFELVVVRFIDQNLSAKRIGYYSTRVKNIILDQIPETAATVPVEELILQNPVFEKSNQMGEVNNYLLRVGPTSKFDFNYQPLANLIKSEWISIEYPEDYYINGGKNTGYLRDEVYSFFIRWVYDTGDKSASYHIPGRAPKSYTYNGIIYPSETSLFNGGNGVTLPGDSDLFQSINTATMTSTAVSLLPDGGRIISRGTMGYWQSTEIYPDRDSQVWNSSSHCWTGVPINSITNLPTPDPAYDLCGKPIRHHKFPDNALHSSTHHFVKNTSGKFFIRLMGVQFKNIIYPKDNDGIDIPGIVGYEILRGSRHGNKSILAKGMINNFRDYSPRGGAEDSGIIGLYANYPFNTIIPGLNTTNSSNSNYQYNDPFIRKTDNSGNKLNQNIPRDLVSFHSPDTSFINPYLSTTELKLYGSLQGDALQYFIEPNKHPKFKLMGNGIIVFALATGVINAILKGLGEIKINYPAGNFSPQYEAKLKIEGGATTNTINGTSGVYGVAFTTPPSYLNTKIKGDNYDQQGQGDPIFLNNEQDEWSGGSGNAAVEDLLFNNAATNATNPGFINSLNAYMTAGGPFAETFIPGSPSLDSIFVKSFEKVSKKGKYATTPAYEKTYTGAEMLSPGVSGFLGAVASGGQLFYYFVEGMQLAVDTLYATLKKRQYALELIGHGDYFKFVAPDTTKDKRFVMKEGQYIFDQLQSLSEYTDSGGTNRNYRINNIKRPKLAVLRTTRSNGDTDGPHFLLNAGGSSIDQSSMTLGHAIRTFNPGAMLPVVGSFYANKVNWTETGKSDNFINKIASHYVGIKYRIENQYGQLETVQQVIATPCEQKIDFIATTGPNSLAITLYGNVCNISNLTHRVLDTPSFFGGDTYVNRFTEKNIMHFFYDTLYDVPDNIEWNYFLNQMIPEPRFQVNSQPWDISEFNLTNLASLFTSSPDYGDGLLPSTYYDLDNEGLSLTLGNTLNYPGFVGVKRSFFYTSANGIRDFFVESDVLVDFRDKGTFPHQKSYSKYSYTDIETLFDSNPAILTKGNYYAYDYSYSASRFLFNQYFTAGYLQGTTYDPEIAELCYVNYPNRITYSLQQQETSNIDAWMTFLPLNKVDFKSKLSAVKNFAKTGMFITFENDSPLIYQGVDTLQLDDSGTKVTVGDAGIFAQAPQNVVVSDRPYEYGSSQNKYAVVSTPAGLYYISQNQGKIFSYQNGLKEISQDGMKWWFSEFLPYKLLEDFPDYPHIDNPVAGIACTASYDNDSSVLYFSKRDFRLKNQFKGQVTYDPVKDNFLVPSLFLNAAGTLNSFKIKLGNPIYFEDASWTLSYDPKLQFWISFHDWHPNFYVPSKGTFMTTKSNGIWKHKAYCNDYCNFYGVQHPFEIELPVPTGQMVNTVKSLEYYLECYRRDRALCIDQYHVLDYNFDQAVIYNSDQVSGYLNLNLYPKNDIPLSLQFPKVNANLNSYDILYSTEEHKYRINQFWDITADRGEFTIGSSYPPSQGPYFPAPESTVLLGNYQDRNLWITSPNGYIKSLNSLNLDYNKPELQRKKFRHYINFIKLSKSNSRDTNMILKIFNTKTQYSPR